MATRRSRTEAAEEVAPLSAEEIAERIRQGEQFDQEAVLAEATEASEDLDELLAELQEVQYRRRYWTATTHEGGRRYEALREKVTSELDGLGAAYFVGADGVKYYAVRRQAESVDVNAELLEAEIGDNEELLDRVMPRKVDKAAFKWAVQDGLIPSAVLVKVARVKRNKPYVDFVAPDQPH